MRGNESDGLAVQLPLIELLGRDVRTKGKTRNHCGRVQPMIGARPAFPSQLLVCAFATLSVLVGSAYAQSGVGVSPPRADITAQPGTHVTQAVEVDNPSASSGLVVEASLSDALLSPDGEFLWLPPGSHANSLAPWLEVNPLQFELDPGERRAVTYTLSVPADAPEGTYWTVIFFETNEPNLPESEPQAAVGVISRVRVGHTIYLTIGQPTHVGSIVGIRYIESGPNGAISVSFQNSGTGMMRVAGRLELRDAAGALVQASTITNNVSFPGTTHALRFDVDSPIESGQYMALVVLDDGAGKVILGEATVTVP